MKNIGQFYWNRGIIIPNNKRYLGQGYKISMAKFLARIGKQIDKIADKVVDLMGDYDQAIREGGYGRQSSFIKSLLGQDDIRISRRSIHSVVGQKAVSGVLSSVGGKLLLGAIAAAVVSTTVALSVGAVILGAGAALLYKNFKRAKEKSKEVMEEINLAGQKVSGTRSDLCRLRDMYIHLQYVENYMPEGSTETPEQKRAALFKAVADERKRVKVLDAGNSGASAETYALPEAEHNFTPARPAEDISKLASLSLVQGWRARLTNTVPVEVVSPTAVVLAGDQPVNSVPVSNVVPIAAARS